MQGNNNHVCKDFKYAWGVMREASSPNMAWLNHVYEDGKEICPKEGGLYGWANKGQERVLAAADIKRGQHEVTVPNSTCIQTIGWAQKSRRVMSTWMLLNRGGAKHPFMVNLP